MLKMIRINLIDLLYATCKVYYEWYNSTYTHTRSKMESEMDVMIKLSYLQARITELFKIKLQITSLFELKNHKDFKRQSKKEQATIMEIIDMLKDMKNLSPQYYQQYVEQNKWAQHLVDTFNNVLFDAP
eukprot:223661_1